MTIKSLFEEKTSLIDSVGDKDVERGYSCLQYVEGYYLIERIIKEKIPSGVNKIAICFVLPNDESKYYLDYPTELERMLRLGFGKALDGIDLKIRFLFFEYGETLDARPYVDRQAKKKDKVKEGDAAVYLSSFNFV